MNIYSVARAISHCKFINHLARLRNLWLFYYSWSAFCVVLYLFHSPLDGHVELGLVGCPSHLTHTSHWYFSLHPGLSRFDFCTRKFSIRHFITHDVRKANLISYLQPIVSVLTNNRISLFCFMLSIAPSGGRVQNHTELQLLWDMWWEKFYGMALLPCQVSLYIS